MKTSIDINLATWLDAVDSVANDRVANCQSVYQTRGSHNDNKRPLLDYSHRVVAREDRISPSNNGLLFAQLMGLRKALPCRNV